MPQEKDEKDEKGRPVEDGRHRDEKGEKFHRDPLSGVFFGLIIILVGVLWLLNTQDHITGWWPWFLVGLGSIFILERLIRYITPAYRRPMFSRILIGVILICIGASFIFGLEAWWPLIVIVIGAAITIYWINRARKPKS